MTKQEAQAKMDAIKKMYPRVQERTSRTITTYTDGSSLIDVSKNGTRIIKWPSGRETVIQKK